MPAIESRIDVAGAAFAARRAAMLARVAEFRALEEKVRAHSERSRERFRRRGQLAPRDRIAALFDPGAPRIELSTLAGLGMHDDDGGDGATGGGTIVALGRVCGARAIAVANDSGIKGGATGPMGLHKGLRAQAIALENRLPMFWLVESAGANLLRQAEVFIEGGRRFCNMARLSAAGVPQFAVVHGSSTAGGAYLPGMSDYVIAVRGRARIFLAGPPLLRAATGEIADEESLGGAEMHAGVAGTAEYLAEDDAHALALARELFAKLDWNARLAPRARRGFRPPRHPVEELAGVVPADYREPCDMREVIARLADDSDFLDFKPLWGPATVCGHAGIEGHAIGIVGNNGPIDAAGAAKAAQFIQACCQAGLPILYLQNVTGYLVGAEAERSGIIKHGAKMIQAVANANVPQLTVLAGGSFGAGNYGMCGRAFDPRFIFAWPNARVAVMGPAQAAKTMAIVAGEKARREGRPADPVKLAAMEREIAAAIETESTALYATARLWDDGLIDPRDTRRVLAECLDIVDEAARRRLAPSSFGVARF